MPDHPDRKCVDHPAPGVILMILLLLAAIFSIGAIPGVRHVSSSEGPSLMLEWLVPLLLLAILAFFLWPFYSTYYTMNSAGIQVRYGPWRRAYPWSDFARAYWQKGLFATRIGWPSVTPCVRLTDAVVLQRKARKLGLYLTPNDSRAFIRRISEFAPELTAEVIV